MKLVESRMLGAVLSAIVCTITLFSPLYAATEEVVEYADVQTRIIKALKYFSVNDDYTVDKTTEIQIKALTSPAVEEIKTTSFSHSTSMETMTILEAYTIKADGSRIAVPENNYQKTINQGNSGGDPFFSDRTKLSIVFPDLDVNDSIYFKMKNTEKKPMFPNNFSVSSVFVNSIAYDDVLVRLDYPAWMDVRHKSNGMVESSKKEDGRHYVTWRYENKKPLKNKRTDYSVWDLDDAIGFAASTFETYEEIGRAYGERAIPKAVPTDRVDRLAQEIVRSENEEYKRANLLYDWVATNISYGGNCIGTGAVVPRDIDTILDNRMGDCKDHAVLLEALLATQGIKSIPALINAGNQYSLPEIPRVEAVNHVLTYIPKWNKFVDSTNSFQPFDSLFMSLQDKPVILAQNHIDGLKTPAEEAHNNSDSVVSKMEILPDGSVTGIISFEQKGLSAVATRKLFREATNQQINDYLKRVFSSESRIGKGLIDSEDPSPLLSSFNYEINFTKPDFVTTFGTGAFNAAPLYPTGLDIRAIAATSTEDVNKHDTACFGGHSKETLIFNIPEGMEILAVPSNMEIKENNIHYNARYDIQDGTLVVNREMVDKTPNRVCSPEYINNQRKTLMKITDNLRSQVVYKF